MRGALMSLLALSLSAASAQEPPSAKPLVGDKAFTAVTKTFPYKQGDTELEGFLALPSTPQDSDLKNLPAIVLVPEWTGPNPQAFAKAKKLAELGAVVLVADIYGKGVRPKAGPEAAKTAGIYKKDRDLLRARVKAAYDEIAKMPQVNKEKIFAIGFCFGGLTALELGRSGADVAGVVSFHGDLTNPTPADDAKIKGKVLVLHGAADPFVPPEQVATFEKNMGATPVDWQVVKYSGAVHSFTNPTATDKKSGACYDPEADRRSFDAMLYFFREILAGK